MAPSQTVRNDFIEELVTRRREVHAAISVGAGVIGTITVGSLSAFVMSFLITLFGSDPNGNAGDALVPIAFLAPGYVIGRIVYAKLRQRTISWLARKDDQVLENLYKAPDSRPGSLVWWIRDFSNLPTRREKLSEHASILHEQAKNVVVFGMIIGLLCGVVAGGFGAALWAVASKLQAILDASSQSGAVGVVKVLTEAPSSNAGAVLWGGALFGVFCGFMLGDSRARQLRSIATIALAMDRIESKLDARMSSAPDSQ